ncbi:MAG: efflux RND transporter periplasmic adaptor subunit, partial [candidate division KSB1 bacterium]|nr:efflux RND transporter periplasmic adaptor subunit [candidate division KSB1 bacterium]
ETESAAETVPLAVEASPARIGDLVRRISATGLTEAIRQVVITPKVGGEIAELPVSEGQFVKKGELLMNLDDREYQLALAEAKDALLDAQVEYGLLLRQGDRETGRQGERGHSRDWEVAKADWEEAQEKYRKGEISDSEYEQARLEWETAQIFSGEKRQELIANKSGLSKALISVKRAELNLSYTEIRAPFSGYVGNLEVEKGQRVSPGQECFKLVDLSQLKVEVGVLESEVGLLQVGRKAVVTFPAYPGEEFHGKVVTINPLVAPESKTCRATVLVENPGGKLKAGMFAYVKLEAQIFKNRFVVPKEAILIRDNRKLLFIVREGLAKWCYVETGLENEELVEITDSTFGLKEGELVITSGHYTLTHDAPVKVIESSKQSTVSSNQ